ncbi:MAG TPA: selenocysteine-specific translation elongation factor [Egibacteraceae bacterium]|nr:selenocysteine-specific translation elongation factor [Egibacteraceae bacterium]
MHVICTAGHVDHGKSTLVKALTGMEPDRFAEEQRRGLTIDLGFAWARLGDPPRTVAFVDLPGHERFVGNMLAGAGAVDLALFVVAADEGWMPQSQEHLEILDLLGVSRGLVAVTKADAVDAETVDLATELVREQLAGSAFADVDVVAVSALTGQGLHRLVERLLAVLDGAPAPADRGRPRLWVDRCFSVRGAGTVVTGTLAGGRLRVGDEVTALPGGRTARVRGLQTLKAAVDEVAPGSRTAVNLSGVDRDEVARGDALGLPGQWLATDALDAWVRALPGRAVGRRGAWHLHVGSCERLATVWPLLGRAIRDSGPVRIELEQPVALVAGDRFVLREAGRQATVGGGVVLDPEPPARARGGPARAARAQALQRRVEALAAEDRPELLALHVGERGAADAARAAAAVGLTLQQARAAARAQQLLTLSGAWAHRQAAARWSAAVTEALATYHAAHPVDRVAPKDVAVRAVVAAGCPTQLVPALLDALVADGRVVAEGPGLRTSDHAVRLDPQQTAARDALLAALSTEPFAPPGLAEAAHAAGASPALVRELEAAGALVRLGADLAVVADALDRAVERLHAAYDTEGPLTAARAKEVLGTSRKYALPLLEELDRRGRTRRRGDVREVIG